MRFKFQLVLFFLFKAHPVFFFFGKTAGENAFQQFIVFSIAFCFHCFQADVCAQFIQYTMPCPDVEVHVIDHGTIQIK